jgi:hypothetical protein
MMERAEELIVSPAEGEVDMERKDIIRHTAETRRVVPPVGAPAVDPSTPPRRAPTERALPSPCMDDTAWDEV